MGGPRAGRPAHLGGRERLRANLIRRGDRHSGEGGRLFRVSGQLGERPAIRAREVSNRGGLEPAGHRHGLSL